MDPRQPFLVDHAHHVGQVLATRPAPDLDRQQPHVRRQADGVLGQLPTDASPRGDLGKAALARSFVPAFVGDDAQHGQFARGELRHEARG